MGHRCRLSGWVGLRHIDAVVVVIVEILGGEERAVGQHKAGYCGKGSVVRLRLFLQIGAGRLGDSVVKGLVRGAAVPGYFNAFAGLARGAGGNVLEHGPALLGRARMPSAVLADGPALKAVALVGADKVHAADQRGLVSGRAHGVGPSRQRRVEDVIIAPDLVGAGPPTSHKGHARWHA